jgi:hypothetical protein
VFASYAALGDINLAEPNALIGFAGARVTAGTIAAELPPGFQRSEFLFAHGFLDRVIHRSELRSEVADLLRYLVPTTFEEPAAYSISTPSFRPLSFLTALADRVMPDTEPLSRPAETEHGGNGSGPAPAVATGDHPPAAIRGDGVYRGAAVDRGPATGHDAAADRSVATAAVTREGDAAPDGAVDEVIAESAGAEREGRRG